MNAANAFRVPRRIVTGHDEHGVSVVISDGPVPVTKELPDDGVTFHEVWLTQTAPAEIHAGPEDPTAGAVTVPPPTHGTRIRINEFLPGHLDDRGLQSPVHRTESIDYGVILDSWVDSSGEVRSGEYLFVVVPCTSGDSACD